MASLADRPSTLAPLLALVHRGAHTAVLQRKNGLFKKAYELGVLCSVDVAVFVFGNNKKLYEYSSTDMRDLITRYQFVSGLPSYNTRRCRLANP